MCCCRRGRLENRLRGGGFGEGERGIPISRRLERGVVQRGVSLKKTSCRMRHGTPRRQSRMSIVLLVTNLTPWSLVKRDSSSVMPTGGTDERGGGARWRRGLALLKSQDSLVSPDGDPSRAINNLGTCSSLALRASKDCALDWYPGPGGHPCQGRFRDPVATRVPRAPLPVTFCPVILLTAGGQNACPRTARPADSHLSAVAVLDEIHVEREHTPIETALGGVAARSSGGCHLPRGTARHAGVHAHLEAAPGGFFPFPVHNACSTATRYAHCERGVPGGCGRHIRKATSR